MRVVIDAFGGDNAPLEIVKGAALASNELGVDVTLTGDKEKIEAVISENALSFKGDLKIVHTEDVISMHDDPTTILKAHNESSMAVAFKELINGDADAFVSAGSTGAIVVGGTLMVKRIKGVKRPALGGFAPSPNGDYLLMDMGANSECRPEMLLQFALMAKVYLEKVEGIANPRIGLLNIGVEDTKGDELRREAYKLLSEAPINFVGNVEARDVPSGACDAVITDGFTGNVALKIIEGTAITLFGLIKKVLYKSLPNKLAALVIKKDLYSLKSMMDSNEKGGVPLLGVSKPVIKAHGSSNAKAIKNAVKQAVLFTEGKVIETITENL